MEVAEMRHPSVHHRPGCHLKIYRAYRKHTEVNSFGSPIEKTDDKPIAVFRGAISRASQKTQEYYRQQQSPVTHEVIVYHHVPVKAGDVLVLGNRKFYVKDIRDPGELNHFFCIMTEEKESAGRYGE